MRKLKWLIPLILGLLVVAIASAMSGRLDNKAPAQQEQPVNSEFENQFPIVDYEVPDTLSPEARAERQSKSAKYNKAPIPLNPDVRENDQILSTLDWETGLPALPVTESNVIVIGQINNARAYLSNDKTAVYSEFTICIDSVLKNNQQMPLKSGDSVAAERDGGRVRFPSGRIILSLTRGQGMPLPGHSYVLFLTHDFPFRKPQENAFHLLTGYELRNGRIFPLDNPGNGTHPMSAYTGANKETLMNDLHTAILNASAK